MANTSLKEEALVQHTENVRPPSTLASGPGTNPTDAKAAIRRCSTAWQRAHKAYAEENEGKFGVEVYAAEAACRA
jgi:hypothetical protein